jgi:murein DD-endopeptidase MepM/ murein hydrolase activator NlpD
MARARETFIATVAAVAGGAAVHIWHSLRPLFAPDKPPAITVAAPAARAPSLPAPDDPLRERLIGLPLENMHPRELRDTFDEARNGRVHEAIDIMAPRGTPVLAVDDGRIAKLFDSKPGGLTVYQFDPTQTFAYYYAHLDRYAPGLAEGQAVTRGQVLGDVGSTGNASPDAPHLHFTIFKLGPEKRWWEGMPVNPLPFWLSR